MNREYYKLTHKDKGLICVVFEDLEDGDSFIDHFTELYLYSIYEAECCTEGEAETLTDAFKCCPLIDAKDIGAYGFWDPDWFNNTLGYGKPEVWEPTTLLIDTVVGEEEVLSINALGEKFTKKGRKRLGSDWTKDNVRSWK